MIGSIKKSFLIIIASLLLLFGSFLLADRLFPFDTTMEYSPVVSDSKGLVLHSYLTSTEKWRMKTEINEISPVLRQAIIHKEDKYFYYHPGINHLAIIRALARNVFYGKRTSGASTITMQVARAIEPKKRSYLNKWIEMFRAIQLEWHYSKNEILQLYLNLVPYGGNIEGVKAAALLYLDKNPDHLSLAEITALSVIPNRPSSLVPGKNNPSIIDERNKWLRRFAQEQVFPAKQVADALNEPFDAFRRPAPSFIPHLARRIRQSRTPTVQTTIDLQMQTGVEKIVSDYARGAALQHIYNASVMVMDNLTGKVLAYCGSSDFSDSMHSGQVDGIVAIREPGSTLKPFVYALAIDKGLMSPKKIIADVPVHYEGYEPENFDKQFNGPVTMEYALEHSLNIPAVKTLRTIGQAELIDLLGQCNFTQVARDRRKLGLSVVLGGCGANLEQLTGIYSALARNGSWVKPSFIEGETQPAKRILSTASSFMITEILSKINRPDFPLNWQSTARMPRIAWKTGTSYGRKDAWSVGYNKRFTVGVWVGNFSGIGNPGIVGALLATPLLFRIFNAIDYNSNESWYTIPPDCEQRLVCAETGKAPSDRCVQVVSDYYIPNLTDMQPCNDQQQLAISPDGKFSYCKTCQPATGYRLKWFRFIENSVQQWYADHHIQFEQIPPHNPACEKVFREGAPVILSPRQGTEFLLSRTAPEPVLLNCRTQENNSRVYWYINDRFYKMGNRIFFTPQEGPLKISCTDEKGRLRSVSISVRMVDL